MKRNIYRILLTAILAFCAAGAQAQMKTSYFMEGSIQRYEMNPAMTPMQGYVNFPLLPLGSFGFSMNNNFLAIDNFLYKGTGGKHVTFMHPSISPREFMRKMPHRASLNTDLNYGLVGFGRYSKKRDYFWSAGWNLRVVADVGIPKEVFGLLKDLHNGNHHIPDITVGATAYSEFTFGFAKPVDWQNLTVGGRVKILMGLAQAEAAIDNIDLDINESAITARAKGSVRASVMGKSYARLPNDRMEMSDLFDFKGIGSGIFSNGFKSWGAAIDLGAEAKFLDQRLKVSIALNDLGFIRWSGANSVQGETDEMWAEFTGYNLDEDEAKFETSEDVEFHKTSNEGYAKRIGTTLNIGAEYNFFDNLLGLGLLSHTKFGNGITYSELTFAGTVRPAKWFTASLSHSLIQNKIGVFGFAFNFHPKGFNFFTGVDYIPARMASVGMSAFGNDSARRIMFPTRAKSVNVYLGLAFGLGRQKPW